MGEIKNARLQRIQRHKRVRRKVAGTPERPRLAVFRSLNHLYAQVIDDTQGKTLAAASSMEAEVKAQAAGKSKSEISKVIGALVARRARSAGVDKVVFDRGGFKYHGRVKALADSAREEGLSI
jgi:large subunit ribosomal protein L18